MLRVLITGMSGTGKSAVVSALANRGLKAIDTDYGYCEMAEGGEWVWKEHDIQDLLSTEDTGLLVVAGCASNQVKFYDQLDLVVLLSAPADVITERIQGRTNNPFGKAADELAQVMRDLESVEPLLRRGADAEIPTDQPLDDVVDAIMALIGAREAK